ncbi:zinc finger CCHC domain-containing protein 9-like isoform X2 [Branchiostoma floridae]|uniref:Zinc finger CCHC domain-containing protein 9-like isoform X2 n=1 Tax=Branchiostoma floridae TaxID=7739 RepID=A0A9J7K8I7_BRAFL|nr:zinc finger CCHC domain-containing protein 9-like isoform X2 [Branchiostoma floridae]
MTRFARGGSGNRKRPEEATPWTKLKPRLTGKSSGKKRHGKSPASSTSHSDGGHRSKHPGNNESELMEKELEEALVRTKRSEQRRLKRIKKKTLSKVCYHCRQPGHGMSECPQMTSDVEQGTGICFRCGSTEHKSARCTTRNIPEQTGKYEHKSARCTTRNIPEQTGKRDLPFAKCFTCGETGHLARSCPDNPRGLYPNGGGCKHCGSVEHHQWQCPSNKASGGSEVIQVSTMDSHTSADLDVIPRSKVKGQPSARKGPKIVKF